MDSRSAPPQQPTMMVGPTSYAPTNTTMISPNSSTTTTANIMAPATARFPFASPQSEPFSVTHDGPSSPSTLGKKKRGRPRKYSPDGNIALGLAPVSSPVAATSAASAGDSGNADAPPKKHRGRPPGSGKKQLDALGMWFCFLSIDISDWRRLWCLWHMWLHLIFVNYHLTCQCSVRCL